MNYNILNYILILGIILVVQLAYLAPFLTKTHYTLLGYDPQLYLFISYKLLQEGKLTFPIEELHFIQNGLPLFTLLMSILFKVSLPSSQAYLYFATYLLEPMVLFILLMDISKNKLIAFLSSLSSIVFAYGRYDYLYWGGIGDSLGKVYLLLWCTITLVSLRSAQRNRKLITLLPAIMLYIPMPFICIYTIIPSILFLLAFMFYGKTQTKNARCKASYPLILLMSICLVLITEYLFISHHISYTVISRYEKLSLNDSSFYQIFVRKDIDSLFSFFLNVVYIIRRWFGVTVFMAFLMCIFLYQKLLRYKYESLRFLLLWLMFVLLITQITPANPLYINILPNFVVFNFLNPARYYLLMSSIFTVPIGYVLHVLSSIKFSVKVLIFSKEVTLRQPYILPLLFFILLFTIFSYADFPRIYKILFALY